MVDLETKIKKADLFIQLQNQKIKELEAKLDKQYNANTSLYQEYYKQLTRDFVASYDLSGMKHTKLNELYLLMLDKHIVKNENNFNHQIAVIILLYIDSIHSMVVEFSSYSENITYIRKYNMDEFILESVKNMTQTTINIDFILALIFSILGFNRQLFVLHRGKSLGYSLASKLADVLLVDHPDKIEKCVGLIKDAKKDENSIIKNVIKHSMNTVTFEFEFVNEHNFNSAEEVIKVSPKTLNNVKINIREVKF